VGRGKGELLRKKKNRHVRLFAKLRIIVENKKSLPWNPGRDFGIFVELSAQFKKLWVAKGQFVVL
jgi:hypothetical protein